MKNEESNLLDEHTHQTFRTSKIISLVDQIVFYLVFTLAALPFGQAVQIKMIVGTLDGFEMLYLLLILAFVSRIVLVGHIRHPLPFIFFSYITLVYSYASLEGRPILDVINQLRLYLPYFVAVLMLLTGTIFPPRRILIGLAYAALVSVSLALYIYYLNPHLLAVALATNTEAVEIANDHGRMFWSNAFILFFVLLALINVKTNNLILKIILILSAIFCVVGAFNTLNRTILIGLVVFGAGSILSLSNINQLIKLILKLIPLLIILTLIISLILFFNERVQNLVNLRFFADGEGIVTAFQSSITGRFVDYEQYIDSMVHHFPLGQGLGVPFVVEKNGKSQLVEYYAIDISFLSFMLPFGLPGLISPFIFIASLYNIIVTNLNSSFFNLRKSLLILVLVSLLISLNYDLYSRNNFVIFLTFIVSSISNYDRYNLKRQKT